MPELIHVESDDPEGVFIAKSEYDRDPDAYTLYEEDESESEPSEDLADLGVRDLREIASEKGVTGYTQLRKDELIEAIRDA